MHFDETIVLVKDEVLVIPRFDPERCTLHRPGRNVLSNLRAPSTSPRSSASIARLTIAAASGETNSGGPDSAPPLPFPGCSAAPSTGRREAVSPSDSLSGCASCASVRGGSEPPKTAVLVREPGVRIPSPPLDVDLEAGDSFPAQPRAVPPPMALVRVIPSAAAAPHCPRPSSRGMTLDDPHDDRRRRREALRRA